MIEWLFEIYQQVQWSWLLILGAFLAVACRELSEHGKENGFTGWREWWNTGESHDNKHTWDDLLLAYLQNAFPSFFAKIWVTRLVGKILSAAFKTALVWTTDAEHFFQLLAWVGLLLMVLDLSNIETAFAVYLLGAFVGFMKSFTKIK